MKSNKVKHENASKSKYLWFSAEAATEELRDFEGDLKAGPPHPDVVGIDGDEQDSQEVDEQKDSKAQPVVKVEDQGFHEDQDDRESENRIGVWSSVRMPELGQQQKAKAFQR